MVRSFIAHPLDERFLVSAASFTRKSYKIEQDYISTNRGGNRPLKKVENQSDHFSYVSAAILLSVSCLETTINGIFEDISESVVEIHNETLARIESESLMAFPPKYRSLGLEKLKLIGLFWGGLIKDTLSLERKYKHIAQACGKEIESGKSHGQDLTLLINLRNSLIHYTSKPIETTKGSEAKSHNQEEKLITKFAPNPMMQEGAYFPYKCLGHGCAEWAVNVTQSFLEYFFDLIELERPDFVRPDYLRYSEIQELLKTR